MSRLSSLFKIRCRGCGKRPHEIPHYRYAAEAIHDMVSADDFVRVSEPTFNRITRRFTCIECRGE